MIHGRRRLIRERGRAASLVLAAWIALAGATPAEEPPPIDADTFGGLAPREIGPAVTSGRIAALDGFQGERLTLFVGAAGGGVWKSVNGGTVFRSVFDEHPQSIGAVKIDPSDPKTVWVGTGESWTRNSVSVGEGLYKTTDGGESWKKVGLERSERIARIAIDPLRPDTVYVAATGHLWDANPERGVYRTRDGGKTWDRVLFVDDRTGCADIAVDPSNPAIVYAAMWQFRRTPHSFSSGGPGSGLFKSSDGGDTWKPIRRGLPAGMLGRIAVAMAPSSPNVVYALVEAKEPGLYRSEDFGESWSFVSASAAITWRPFYFSHLVIDPKNADRVYKPGLSLAVSEDGGRTFAVVGQSTHGDHHALWINPANTEQLVLGTDGGVYISEDRGARWRFVGTLPVAQFYHVSVDMEWPYNVYGGLQDNGSWRGPSRRSGGIAARHWRVLSAGDGFWAFVDPHDPDVSYAEFQGGNLRRIRASTGELKEIKPYRRADEPEYRFNWNTPIHMSPTQPGTMYLGAQFLLRSRDRGDTWERISPDLTTNDPAKQRQEESGGLSVDNSSAENHCTIYTIAESPRDAGVVWVGTDDGNVQLTRDGGRGWTLVSKKIAGLPPGTWVSTIEPSHQDAGAAYVTFDGHQTGDMKTYVYRVTDYGKTWQALATPELTGYAHVVREDPVEPRLLFLGTESGLFVSIDRGARWAPIRSGFPPVAVRDLAIHPREGDLAIATHGRGLWILDDLTPLRRLTPEVIASDAALLPSRPAALMIPSSEQRFDADADFEGRSLGDVAFVSYWLKKRHVIGDFRLEMLGPDGALIGTLPAGKRRGLNRALWPMRMKPPRTPPATNLVPQPFANLGPRMPPGRYTARLIRGGDTLTTAIELAPDPRSTHSAEDRALQQSTVLALYRRIETLTWLVDAVADARDQARARAGAVGAGSLAKRLTGLADRLEALRKTLVATREGGRLTGEEQLREKLAMLYGSVNGYDGRPTTNQIDYAGVLGAELEKARRDFEGLAKELTSINDTLAGRKLEPIRPLTPEDWAKRQAG